MTPSILRNVDIHNKAFLTAKMDIEEFESYRNSFDVDSYLKAIYEKQLEYGLIHPFKNGVFSNWYSCTFQVTIGSNNIVTFNSMEQCMMYQKAFLFKDFKSMEKILKAKNPKECKNLGREVVGFSSTIWDIFKVNLVKTGLLYKFIQNPTLLSDLLKTANTVLVEASLSDKIWACGLDLGNADIYNPDKWQGQNLLGESLTYIRNYILLSNINLL